MYIIHFFLDKFLIIWYNKVYSIKGNNNIITYYKGDSTMNKQIIITIRYYSSYYKSHDIYTTEPITVKTAFRWLWENIKEGDFPYYIKIQRA